MTILFFTIIFALSLATLAINSVKPTDKKWYLLARKFVPMLPFVALLAALAGLQFGYLTESVNLILTALLVPLLVVPWSNNDLGSRRAHQTTSLVTFFALILLAGYAENPLFINGLHDQYSLLVIGLIGILGTLAALFSAAAALSPTSRIPLVMVAAASSLATFLLGQIRSNLDGLHYAIPLATTSQSPILWTLPGWDARPDGLRFFVTADLPYLPHLLLGTVLLALLYTYASIQILKPNVDQSKDRAIRGVGAALAAASLIYILIAASSPTLPTTTIYDKLAHTLGSIPNNTYGGFHLPNNLPYDKKMGVALLKSSFFFDAFFSLLSLLAFLLSFRFDRSHNSATESGDSNEKNTDSPKTINVNEINTLATIMIRATLCCGLIFAGAGLYQIRYLGVAWIGSSSEWIALALFAFVAAATYAIVILRSSLLKKCSVPRTQKFIVFIVSAAIFAVVLSIGWAASYQTLPGFSFRLF